MRRQLVQQLLPSVLRGGQQSPAVCGASGQLSQQIRGFADDANLKKTGLYDFNVEHGGKMVPFAGWAMPIQYKDSLMESAQHCRKAAALFDVAHMCGLSLKGKGAVPFLETLVTGDIAGLADGTGSLSVFTNERGGIIDDTVITKVKADEVYLVVNAGCRDKDLAHLDAHLAAARAKGHDVAMEVHDDRGLVALQGPKAQAVLQTLTKFDLSKLYFGNFARFDVAGAPVWVTRTGYTGEDGFEISVPNAHIAALAARLVSNADVRLAGLGARDALRLEAGLCLYGNDLNEDINPVDAGLAWVVGKRRRVDFGFLGGEAVKKALADGAPRRRVGFVSTGAPARQHSEIRTADGALVGEVTSGAFSPTLKANVAMGYVDKPHDKAGTQLKLVVRGKANDATVTKMPFVPVHYYKG